jgi:GNAT superfamily N-acetyltransferase
VIRTLAAGDAPACDAIVAGLPEWFGLEEGIQACARAVRSRPGLVADTGQVVGFLTYEPTAASAAEITWMAVRADRRRTGLGRALVDDLADRLVRGGVRLLLVKTLSSRARSLGYEETRAFYVALGFEPALELDVWGPEDPALLLVRPL